jgi:periplasmic divalent cation tolerance protein
MLTPPVIGRAPGAARRTIGPMAGQDKALGTRAGFLQVQTTTDSRAEAIELAHAAVAARLAACAQVAGPIASTFWWEESLERAEEWLIMLKLPADRYDELAEFLAERHSYDEPEIIATPIVAGSPGYLSWMEEETRRE